MNGKYTYSDDAHLVADVMQNSAGALHYFLHVRYRDMLRFHAMKAAPGLAVDDLVQELYLYLSANDWSRLRKYDPRLPLEKWLSVVSYRFFKDYFSKMIDMRRQVPISNIEDDKLLRMGTAKIETLRMDLLQAINLLPSERDREVVEALVVHDEEPRIVAARLGITVDNLYNIKRRAIARLATQYLSDYAPKR